MCILSFLTNGSGTGLRVRPLTLVSIDGPVPGDPAAAVGYGCAAATGTDTGGSSPEVSGNSAAVDADPDAGEVVV